MSPDLRAFCCGKIDSIMRGGMPRTPLERKRAAGEIKEKINAIHLPGGSERLDKMKALMDAGATPKQAQTLIRTGKSIEEMVGIIKGWV